MKLSRWLNSIGPYRIVLYLIGSYLLLSGILRIVLARLFAKELDADLLEIVIAFFVGIQRDLFVAAIMSLPLVIFYAVFPKRWFGKRLFKILLYLGLWVYGAIQIFICAAEFFFFEEFQSRFNTVAVDYLIYPHEVVGNIRDSYPVYEVITVCILLGGLWAYIGVRFGKISSNHTISSSSAWKVAFGNLVLVMVYALTVPYQGVNISKNRVVNQLAENGQISFVSSAYTRHLDFPIFYKTIDKEEAFRRVREFLQQDSIRWLENGSSIVRELKGDPSKPPLNLVLIIEESLGSEFWGVLGRTNSLTPNMDRICEQEGWLFENIYATGTRTVRGLEGILCGFPPLPGDSIVWRLQSKNVETLARVLKRDGYRTLFMYAGSGLFDRMKGFCLQNGFDRFIEEKDFESPVFKTVWGVSDEDLLLRAVKEIRKLHESGGPFFVVILTISNHKPYLYPKGRIPEDPEARRRAHVVKYADYALGQFFEAVKKEDYWKETIFVVVADHGARVYGAPDIPIKSYEIPFVIIGPAVVDRPRRFDVLGSQMDIPVTLLSLIGRPYKIMFFGRNLFDLSHERGRAFLNHNRDIAIYDGAQMVVYGLNKSIKYYIGHAKKQQMQLVPAVAEKGLELEKEGIAVFQVADELYMEERYRLDP